MSMRQLWVRCSEGHLCATVGKAVNGKRELFYLGMRAGKEHDRRNARCYADVLFVSTNQKLVHTAEERWRNERAFVNGVATFKRTAGMGLKPAVSEGTPDGSISVSAESCGDAGGMLTPTDEDTDGRPSNPPML